ncbi:GGDEF domain-containing protein [Phyllobacterium sp. 628]|uniref:GGDEF domain-containing protein n=1 Tax=Phyllobacterium sp. 628 TaxID=2718938 RepID=UPI001662824E|nr:GGDEF domain-containing protein [Phyllobacterium sp. 628]QND53286.1 GGDEF domain-containing protein [Phyllobacterium sp. 628]
MNIDNPWMTKFGALSPFKQVAIMVGMAVISSDILAVLGFYIVGLETPYRVAAVTTGIVVLVSLPLGAFLVALNFKLKQLAEQLDLESRKDDLTGLLNRAEFYLQTQRLFASSRPIDSAGALLYIDADHFKSINDRYGHAKGDDVIHELGRVIKSNIGERDLAARIGGEEFTVFLTDADLGRANWISHKILIAIRSISKELELDATPVTVSIGVALHTPGQSLEEALAVADKYLYSAKHQGRNRVVYG